MFEIGDLVKGKVSGNIYKVLGAPEYHSYHLKVEVELLERGRKTLLNSVKGNISFVPITNLSFYKKKSRSHPLTSIFKDIDQKETPPPPVVLKIGNPVEYKISYI